MPLPLFMFTECYKNKDKTSELLCKKVAIVHWKGHQKIEDTVTFENHKQVKLQNWQWRAPPGRQII